MMNKSDGKIHIVGAGVSGLVAATVLEAHGYRSCGVAHYKYWLPQTWCFFLVIHKPKFLILDEPLVDSCLFHTLAIRVLNKKF